MKKILIQTGKKAVRDILEPLYIDSLFVQTYSGVEEVLYKIRSVCALHLLQWVLWKMNKYNTVTLTRVDKKQFIYKSGNKYSISGVNKGLAALKEVGIIISTNEWLERPKDGKLIKTRTGMYYINPHYFWKNPS